MRASAAVVGSLLLALAMAPSCSDGGQVEAPCSPECAEGKVCRNGRCVAASSGLDAGENIISPHADGGGGVLPGPADAGAEHCAAESTRAQQMPLGIYVMLDQSGSMNGEVEGGGTRWSAVTGALNSFLSQPLTDVSVGIQYFGIPAVEECMVSDCSTDADCGEGCGPCMPFVGVCTGYFDGEPDNSCNPAVYAEPDVEIAALSTAASAIASSMQRHSPEGDTPTSAALQGAINHGQAWAQSHAGHVVIVILATDGEPTECETDLGVINGIAAGGANGAPEVLTFVIGVGSSLTNLNGIAQAGGTGQAFLVDTSADVTTQFLDALNQIRGTALGCIYKIPVPDSGTPDFAKVNFQYTPGGGGSPVVIPKVAGQASCPAGKDAWYYDDPANPKQIILCPSTCAKVRGDSSGVVDVLLGCSTIVEGPN